MLQLFRSYHEAAEPGCSLPLDPGRMYSVRLAPEGKEILKATGNILMEKGFIVSVENEIDGKIFEITAE